MVDELKRDFGQRHEGTGQGGENSFILSESRTGWYIRNKLFPVRVVIDWDGLCREDVSASSSEVFQTKSDKVGATWSKSKCPCAQQGVELDSLLSS